MERGVRSSQPHFTFSEMADFPASPPFNNALLANDDQLNTPAVPAGGIDEAVIGREALGAFKASTIRLASIESISEAELGMATYRVAEAIAQFQGGALMMPWVAQALAAGLAPLLAGSSRRADGASPKADGASPRADSASPKADSASATTGSNAGRNTSCRTDFRILLVNSRILSRNQDAHVGTTTPFAPPAKFNLGFLIQAPHPAMANFVDVPADIAPAFEGGPPVPGPDVFPPANLPFPQHSGSILTIEEIGYLCCWYCDDFGILGNDPQETVWQKFKNFLRGR
ncbi:hypothetical protein AC1031_001017 [Aphanomyces cochlioides]|nr:hypothetical protein AC1031_001017 [Aphanomyces cochlioides]